MQPELQPILNYRNSHRRDKNILFYEESHKYIITNDAKSSYTSVTTWNHSHFPKFNADDVISSMMKGKGWKEGHKYWGLTAQEIKDQWNTNKTSVADSGTDLHYKIECFMNNPKLLFEYTNNDLYNFYMTTDYWKQDKTPEWQYFIQFLQHFPDLKPYRTEWTIYHEDVKIAGSIDMIYQNTDGTLSIYDWKRAKNITRINNFNNFALSPTICHLPDANFWHYAMQLNTYKVILEEKYNKKIKDLYLVRLHPDAEEKSYELIELPDLTSEVKELFEERKKNIYRKCLKR
jgi:ATP-dependent exoDNAse (exonuclease V) beta subunit